MVSIVGGMNPGPLGHESSALTTRPLLLALNQTFFVFSPVQSEVRKGETIVLSCGASGFPEPTYEWYRDGGRLSSAHSRYKVIQLNV